MDKYLSSDAFITTTVPLVSTTKKIAKKTKFDIKRVKKITKVGLPEILGKESMYNSKYKIKLNYKDGEGREHDKTVLFGHPERLDYVDHGNVKCRDMYLTTLKEPTSRDFPEFEAVFWDRMLLNGEETQLQYAFFKLKDKILRT